MPLLGAHMSIAGGYYKAVDAAAEFGMATCQIFTKNNNQWGARPISAEEVAQFREALARTGVSRPTSHDSYLINLASPDETLWRRSVEAFVVELQRAEQLGIEYVVTHPGAYTTSSEEAGLARVAVALDEVHAQTAGLRVVTLLENTAGQGSCLGWRFEHLAEILERVKDPDRVAVCLDTCHMFAAGYPLATAKEYAAAFREVDRTVGLGRVRAFHLNDSKRELGSRVDRHEKIGAGKLGLEPFRRLLNDARFQQTPMYLETPKGKEGGVELDAINMATLHGLIEPRKGRK